MNEIIFVKLNTNIYKIIILNYKLNDGIEFKCHKELNINLNLNHTQVTTNFYIQEGIIYNLDEIKKSLLTDFIISNSSKININIIP